ncbi:MAG TPA: HAD hydrolase-like protein [Dehalococcoidia bacterium]|nr:HAD hydrolase-like protein [Dehalococcoidia bacterium]
MAGPLEVSRYRHVVWDWNGTLLDDVDVARGVVDKMLRRRGLAGLSVERYHAIFDFPIEDYYVKAGFDFEVDPFPRLADEFHAGYRPRWSECRLHTEALGVLEWLAVGEVRQTVLSASHQPALEEQVEFFGVQDHFAELVGIDDHHGGSKVAQGQRWLQAAEESAGEVVLVGDTAHDFEVAREMGVDCILVADGHQPRERLEECGVPVVDSLAELLR